MDATRIMRNTAFGIAGGLAASLIMNKAQAGASWLNREFLTPPQGDGQKESQKEPATVKAADEASKAATGKPVPEPDKETAGEAVHYGFGALLGALYGALGTPFPALRAGFGTVFGAATWAGVDEGLVPVAGLSETAEKTPLSLHVFGLASHLLFGTALEGSQRLLEKGADAVSGQKRSATR